MFAFKTQIALGALVGAAVIPLAAAAAEAQAAPDQNAAPAIAEAQVVARDPETGKLRAATAEEVQALRAARAAQRGNGPITSATHTHPSGAVGARLTDQFMNYSVVVRTADGKLVELCVEDPATLTAKPAQAKKLELPTE